VLLRTQTLLLLLQPLLLLLLLLLLFCCVAWEGGVQRALPFLAGSPVCVCVCILRVFVKV